MSTNTGTITGTPTTAASSTVTATLTDAVGRTATTTFTWVTAAAPTVADPGAQTGTIGVAVSKTITASGGTTPFTWSATGLPAGLSIDAASGTITGTPTTGGTGTVTVTATDPAGRKGTATFTWAIAAPAAITDPGAQTATVGQSVTSTLSATGGTSPYTWTASGLPTGLSINAGSGAITGTPTAAGSTTATVTVTDAAGRSGSVQIAWTVTTALSLTNPGDQSGSIGVAGSLTLQAAGGISPYGWTATGLPDGLSLNAGTGVISGSPTNPATWAVTIKVTDKAGNTQITQFNWTITSPLTLAGPGAQNPTQYQNVSLAPTAAGGATPYRWTATGLPTGLSLDTATGKITGAPSTVGAISSTLTVTDAGGRTAAVAIAWQVFQATLNTR